MHAHLILHTWSCIRNQSDILFRQCFIALQISASDFRPHSGPAAQLGDGDQQRLRRSAVDFAHQFKSGGGLSISRVCR